MSDFTLSFFGATGEVTGSAFLLETGGPRVLIDCGLFQGGRDADDLNAEDFPFDPASIDAVVLTHAHIDHSGRLPLLVKRGFKGRIHTHGATLDLARIMLKDSAFLAEREAERDNRRRSHKGKNSNNHKGLVEPLYCLDDVDATIEKFVPHDYGQRVEVAPQIAVVFRDAGHILGSAIVEMWVEAAGITRKIVFSGDLGHRGAPLLKDPSIINTADVVLVESTYGDRSHRSWDDTFSEIGDILSRANSEKGNILIPTFAVGRAQELLYLFSRYYEAWNLKEWEIFLDSPMAIEVTDVYSRHTDLFDSESLAHRAENGSLFSLPNLHLTDTREASMGINAVASGAIILAGSGMCTGGRIRHHIQHKISNPNNHLMIVGFQARGTLGRMLVDGIENIRMWGQELPVAAQVHTIGGLSAHAGADGLVDWCSAFGGRPRFILIHGEPGATAALATRLEDDTGIQAYSPERGAVYDLASLVWKKSPRG